MTTADLRDLLLAVLLVGMAVGAIVGARIEARRERRRLTDDDEAEADIAPYGLGYCPPLASRRPWLPGDTHGRNQRLTGPQRRAVWERSRQERRHA